MSPCREGWLDLGPAQALLQISLPEAPLWVRTPAVNRQGLCRRSGTRCLVSEYLYSPGPTPHGGLGLSFSGAVLAQLPVEVLASVFPVWSWASSPWRSWPQFPLCCHFSSWLVAAMAGIGLVSTVTATATPSCHKPGFGGAPGSVLGSLWSVPWLLYWIRQLIHGQNLIVYSISVSCTPSHLAAFCTAIMSHRSGVSGILCKCPDSDYFRLGASCCLCHSHLRLQHWVAWTGGRSGSPHECGLGHGGWSSPGTTAVDLSVSHTQSKESVSKNRIVTSYILRNA